MQMNMSDIQKAFALAHKAGHNSRTHDRERKYFRAIAHLIWRACETDKAEQHLRETPDLAGFNHLEDDREFVRAFTPNKHGEYA